ncbi:Flp pilus assembly protein CpaB [Evansella sp. AB-rgal1]|uniref:Flp pilus assembly protein CpaB n=1 Tax=Evansella sp. AB-rgal1 TaxID=3242696 RepID=UPI00359DAA60
MRSKMVLLLALVMGIISTVLFFQYIQQYGQAEDVMVRQEPMATVVTAREKITMNQLISVDVLEMTEVPEQGLHPSTVMTMADLEGQFATTDIEQGEVILTHRMKSEKEENRFVSRKVQEGNRAVSINVNYVQSVSTLIEPEDFVDVILTEEKKGEEEVSTYETSVVLEEVRVLSVGRKMIPPTSGTEEHIEYNAVTLELSPDDAREIINASYKGPLQLILHSSLIHEDNTK